MSILTSIIDSLIGRVSSEGTVYECIKAHNASWTRQPPNAEYWRTV